MQKIKIFIGAFLILIILSTPLNSCRTANSHLIYNKSQALDNYYKYFYNRYSRHFDKFGWLYAAPSYGEKEWQKPKTNRMRMTIVSYYKYRAKDMDIISRIKIRQTVLKVIHNREKYNSFNQGIAYFLVIDAFKNFPNLFTYQEKRKALAVIAENLNNASEVKESDNRAALSAVYWYWISRYLLKNNWLCPFDFQIIKKRLDKKINTSIKETISPDFYYYENKKFSLHYMAVEAYMLALYGDMTKQVKYVIYARELTKNLRKFCDKSGKADNSSSYRPVGLGAQFYLMMGLLSKRFDYSDANIFLTYAKNKHFFSDPRYPNRLVYTDKNGKNFHDDYSFVNMAEISLNVKSFKSLFNQ